MHSYNGILLISKKGTQYQYMQQQHVDKPQKHYAELKKKHSGKDKTQRKLGKWLPRPGGRGQ